MNVALFILYLFLVGDLGLAIINHGKQKPDQAYCWWVTLIEVLIVVTLVGWSHGWRFL